jgi:translation initiation factor 2B subunit (eIF-2B alpha/beta/delta family)
MSLGGEAWARTLLHWTWKMMNSIENNQNIWYKTEPFHVAVYSTLVHVKRERKEASEEDKENCKTALKKALEFVDDHGKHTEDDQPAEVEDDDDDIDVFE